LNSVNGGQSDWYLPSIDELSLLWNNRFNVNKTLFTINGATELKFNALYFSSTENFAGSAWGIGIFSQSYNDYSVSINKSFQEGYVRAVRAF
jgi:hypothetical protein